MPHCSSQQALDLVKREVFRRAEAVRGRNEPAFNNVAVASVVRLASRVLRKHDSGSDVVTCTGPISIDLPPGVAIAGGRHSLTSNLTYVLEPKSDGTARLVSLGKADLIVFPLATISEVASPPSQPISTAPPPTPPEQGHAIAADEPRRPEPNPAAGGTPRSPAPQPKKHAPASAPPAAQPNEPPPQREIATPVAPRTTTNEAAAEGSVPIRAVPARPSFNCRYARTRGEIAVCSDAGLSSLDRQMATQFYGAMSVARPGQRAMLQRTRGRFLRYRDSCPSQSCMTDAYRRRMREISGIMGGPW
jgi:uncharacterized protein YecT (DUF1311 family)